MEFLWDSANIDHIALHNITPAEAEQVIANEPIDVERQLRNSEERMLHLGETDAGRVLFVVVTWRGEVVRVVTAYPADKAARTFYSLQRDAIDEKDSRDP